MTTSNSATLLSQVEHDRKMAHASVDQKFDALIRAVKDVYGTKRSATTNVVSANATADGSEQPSAEPSGSSVDGTPPANDSAAPIEHDEKFHDNCTAVRMFLLEQPDGAGRAAILEATGIIEADFKPVVDFLMTENRIRRSGQKRGTTYHVVTAFDDPTPAAASDSSSEDDGNEEEGA